MSAHTEELFLSPEELKMYKIKKVMFNVLIYGFLVLIALFIIIPFYYMILTSLQTPAEIEYTEVINLWPKNWAWSNYGTIFKIRGDGGSSALEIIGGNIVGDPVEAFSIWTMYANTIIIAVLTTAGTIISVVFSAFAFSRLNFKGKEVIFSLLLATMMIPGEIYTITNYQMLATMKDSYVVLILPFMTSVFYTFFLRQTFRQIPNELYLAARVDGVGDFGYLFKVMIPIAKSTILTIVILSMIGTWNAYVWPNLMTTKGSMYLVSNGLQMMFSGMADGAGASQIIPQRMAASTMVTVPLLIVFICLRKYIMGGVSRSGIKG